VTPSSPIGTTQQLVTVDAKEGCLVGFRRLKPNPPGLVLPVFVSAAATGLLLYQRRNDADEILEFAGDRDLRATDLVSSPLKSVFVRVGDPALHAYETPEGDMIVGKRDEFRTCVHHLLIEHSLNATPFAGLEVARFVNDAKFEVSYARQCAQTLAARSRELAACWIEGTSLSPDALRAARSAVTESIASGDSEHDIAPELNEHVHVSIKKIVAVGRQEERLAMIFDEILKDQTVGVEILRRYGRDRATWANNALEMLDAASLSGQKYETNQIVLGKVIKKMYQRVFPNSRGIFLYFMAKHLAKHPLINALIRYQTNASYSIYVADVRNKILSLLAKPAK
jgi:hypothetical protein